MAGVKFTPGPWVPTERHGYHEIIGPREQADWYGDKGVWAVAYCDTDRDDDENIANARLIAASPDLAAAAAAVLAWWDTKLANELASHKDFPWAEDAEWAEFQALRRAIAKAEGRS